VSKVFAQRGDGAAQVGLERAGRDAEHLGGEGSIHLAAR
jgi:hypothetical protein